MDETMKFNFQGDQNNDAKEVLFHVYEALKEKGYNPINQIVGYLISGDPAYIPRHKNARAMIRKLERDELIEELVTFYLENKK
ncbi:IreB family regulatory phosphoprotein [Staphylospora marina]|uniref:IreB family regulatory phosphoprotein n=1 Tax=Staphylospora marina TaxID=2490858 RepID=UPI000F5C121A|nr:IreB family regulatory phosphoprotein [Staphylospora marina]